LVNKGGRPLKYKTVEELEKKINEYFEMCDNKQLHYTITGLALYLDVDRRTITDYAHKEMFSPTIKKAKLKVENYLENNLFGNNVTGVIFNLKNNFGWKDKTEQDINANIEIAMDKNLKELAE
jgi:predicted transcriptional regulator